MTSIIFCSEGCTWQLELTEVEGRFVARFVLGVEFLIVIRIVDVQLEWTDANDWTWEDLAGANNDEKFACHIFRASP